MKTFENTDSLKLASLKAGQLVETKGYFLANDGGGETYYIVPAQAVDGVINHLLANGNIALSLQTTFNSITELKATNLGAGAKVEVVSDGLVSNYVLGGEFDDLKAFPLTKAGLYARPVWAKTRVNKDAVTHNDGSLFSNHGTMVVAHRNGGFGVSNSVYNYQKMLDTDKYQAIEIDMCISADGVLYNYHDIDVSLETDGTGNFWELDSSYIDTLKFTANAGTVFEDDPIPRLTDIFDLVRETGCWLFAEAKFFRGGFGAPQYSDVTLMIDLAAEYGILDKFILTAFDKVSLVTGAEYNNELNLLRYISTYSDEAVDFTKYMPTNAAIFVAVAEGELTSARATYIRDQGMIPAVWTVNSSISQQRWIAAGVSIILSDNWGVK